MRQKVRWLRYTAYVFFLPFHFFHHKSHRYRLQYHSISYNHKAHAHEHTYNTHAVRCRQLCTARQYNSGVYGRWRCRSLDSGRLLFRNVIVFYVSFIRLLNRLSINNQSREKRSDPFTVRTSVCARSCANMHMNQYAFHPVDWSSFVGLPPSAARRPQKNLQNWINYVSQLS